METSVDFILVVEIFELFKTKEVSILSRKKDLITEALLLEITRCYRIQLNATRHDVLCAKPAILAFLWRSSRFVPCVTLRYAKSYDNDVVMKKYLALWTVRLTRT